MTSRSSRAAFHGPSARLAMAAFGVVSVLGGVFGFAGSASALLTATPISAVMGPNSIQMIPTGTATFGHPTNLLVGQSDQPATSWTFDLSDTGTYLPGTANTWGLGDVIAIPVFAPGGVNNLSAGAYVEFAGIPTMTCVGGGAGATQPTFTITTTENPNDSVGDAGLTDLLLITFTNNPTLQSPTPFSCVISGVAYTVGANTGTGSVGFGGGTNVATYTQGIAPGTVNPVGGTAGTDQQTLNVQVNANIVEQSVTANSPAVSVLPNAIDAPISPIVITEAKLGAVSGNYICITASQSLGTNGFVVTPTSPTITLHPSNTGGTGTVTGAVVGLTPNANGSFQTIAADVLVVSTTVPTTYTFSNLMVDAPGTSGDVTVSIVVGATIVAGACSGGTTLTIQGNPDFAPPTIYAVGQPTGNTRVAGSTADQTAVAALETQYPPRPGFCLPSGVTPNPNRFQTGSSVVLATDGSWQDALTASYLASWLRTGVLLTPTGTLSPYTAQALQQEGVSNVVIVGGPLAVSTAVENQLASTPAYQCGGAGPQLNALGQPIDLSVQRVYGTTADGTAEMVATYVDSGFVNNLNISGAFGLYNDTTGTDSGSSPTIPVRTAILVTDNFFQDAASASGMSYYEHLPILLTPQGALGTEAETGLLDLGIQQVIELGGPLAISNAVNASLASQGISVLRIAGADGSETSVMLAKFELNNLANAGLGEFSGNTPSYGTGCLLRVTRSPIGSQLPLATTILPNPVPYYADCTIPVALARGDYFADALTSSVITGGGYFGAQFIPAGPEPVILAESPTTLGTYATDFFNQAGSPYGIDPTYQTPLSPIPGSGFKVTSITVFGGPLAIANSTLQAALNAISEG